MYPLPPLLRLLLHLLLRLRLALLYPYLDNSSVAAAPVA
jgi:hypothetical protein